MKINFFASIAAALLCASVMGPGSGAAGAPDVVAFCKAHPNVDFPNAEFSGATRTDAAIPKAVEAAGATNWRCMDGAVLVCNGGASGSACQKMDASREPTPTIRESCADDPHSSFIAIAVIGNSSSTWRCNDGKPEIIKSVPLDKRGFMTETWSPILNTRGKLRTNIDLAADPR